MRLKLVLAYDGTAYSGWQVQEKPNPPPTIQGAVENALFALTGKKTRVFGAGRTDSGVHAHGQVAHCDIAQCERYERRDWRKALNALLPGDIRVISTARAAAAFHSRKSAVSKTYVYQFWLDQTFMPPHLRNYAWACGPLDIASMRGALPSLLGSHDFASFQNSGTDISSTRRQILALSLDMAPLEPFYLDSPPMLRLSMTATGFLKQMGRNLAGCLAAIGKGRLKAGELQGIIAARDRRCLPAATAPARGLALARVAYGPD